jgi:hypothetical protein
VEESDKVIVVEVDHIVVEADHIVVEVGHIGAEATAY